LQPVRLRLRQRARPHPLLRYRRPRSPDWSRLQRTHRQCRLRRFRPRRCPRLPTWSLRSRRIRRPSLPILTFRPIRCCRGQARRCSSKQQEQGCQARKSLHVAWFRSPSRSCKGSLPRRTSRACAHARAGRRAQPPREHTRGARQFRNTCMFWSWPRARKCGRPLDATRARASRLR
jgi:hypothetical protein